MGRLRIQIRDKDGAPLREDIKSGAELLRWIGQRLPEIAATAKVPSNPLLPPPAKTEGSRSSAATATGGREEVVLSGVTLVPRSKKKKQGGKK